LIEGQKEMTTIRMTYNPETEEIKAEYSEDFERLTESEKRYIGYFLRSIDIAIIDKKDLPPGASNVPRQFDGNIVN